MSLKVVIQMDPIGPINIDGDSTFRIMEEAQARGHSLFYYTPDKLVFQEGRVTAKGWPVTVQRVHGDHFWLGDEIEVDLSDFDVLCYGQRVCTPHGWGRSHCQSSYQDHEAHAHYCCLRGGCQCGTMRPLWFGVQRWGCVASRCCLRMVWCLPTGQPCGAHQRPILQYFRGNRCFA